MRIRFEEVKLKATRRWRENGKPRQETRTFMQTLNPFNRGENGMPKSRLDIMRELQEERDSWLRRSKPKSNPPWHEVKSEM